MSEPFDPIRNPEEPPSTPELPPSPTAPPRAPTASDDAGAARAWLSRLLPPAVGIVGTVLIVRGIELYTEPGSFLLRTFLPEEGGIGQLVPSAICLLFLWTLTDLAIKGLGTWRERSLLGRPPLSRLAATVEADGAAHAAQTLAALPDSQRSRAVVVRLRSLLELLVSTRSARRSHEAFRHQSEIAMDASAASYSTARVFIWAMPILGFIGTVFGIGSAVGEFSGFLTGDIEDVELVKAELSKIATGLSFAFDTTLLGLLASLPSMLFMAFVQKSEESLGASLEELGLAIVAHAPDRAPVTTGGNVDPELLVRVAGGLDRLDQDFGTLEGSLGNVHRALDSLTTTSSTLSGRIEESSEHFDALGARAVELAGSVRQAGADVETAVEGVAAASRSSAGEITEAARHSAERLAEASAQSADQLVAASQGTAARVEAATGFLADRVEASSRQLVGVADRLAEHVDRLAVENRDVEALGHLVERVTTQLAEIQKQHAESLGVVSQLGQPLEFRLVRRPAETS